VSCLIPFPAADPVDDEPLWWFGHDDVDRVFDDATMLCPCLDCTEALRREAARRPRRPIGLKTGGDRIVVTAEYLVEVMGVDDTLEPLFYLPDDYLRDIFVVVARWRFRRRARWWSLACEEDEEAEGRRPAARRVAKRQPIRLQAPAAEPVVVPDEGSLPPHLVSLHDAVADSRRRHRGLVTAAGQWALARGLSLPADHVALWAAAAEDRGTYGDADGITGPWLRPGFHGFLWSTLWNWCTVSGCRWPADLPESLWHLYGFLADSGRLHPDSDPLPELRKVLVCSGGLGLDGRPNPGRSPIPCECYRDYTGPRHGAVSPPPGDPPGPHDAPSGAPPSPPPAPQPPASLSTVRSVRFGPTSLFPGPSAA
jgi:hypothetical protein